MLYRLHCSTTSTCWQSCKGSQVYSMLFCVGCGFFLGCPLNEAGFHNSPSPSVCRHQIAVELLAVPFYFFLWTHQVAPFMGQIFFGHRNHSSIILVYFFSKFLLCCSKTQADNNMTGSFHWTKIPYNFIFTHLIGQKYVMMVFVNSGYLLLVSALFVWLPTWYTNVVIKTSQKASENLSDNK